MTATAAGADEAERMLVGLAEGAPAPGPLLGARGPHMAQVCGALGSFERSRVLQMAAAMTPEMRIVHETEGVILMLDREPRRWGPPSGAPAGIAWPSELVSANKPRSWGDAAREWNAAGLETGPGRPRLHSSVSGLSPLYLQREPGATYFATAIDPLARSSPGKLTADWQAWSSIFTLGFPIAGRTPFQEIEHLGPWRTISHQPGGSARIEAPSWPWAAIEPTLSAKQGAEAIAAALQTVFSRLAGKQLLCPMSAGRDSRMLSWLAMQCGAASVRAYTTYEDTGTRRAIEIAAAAARSLGLPHTQIEPGPEQFWEDARCYQLSCDYQFPNAPWLSAPIRRVIGGIPGLTVDGIAGNALFEPTARNVPPQVITEPGRRWRALLWQKMRTRALFAAFRQSAAAKIGWLAREQFLAGCDAYTGHPARAALAFYETRTVRAIALRPASNLGQVCAVVSPLAEAPVAEALLAVRPAEKFDRKLYQEVFRALGSQLDEMAFSSAGAGAALSEAPRRRSSAAAMQGYREIARSGPLAPHLAGKVRGWLGSTELAPEGGRRTINGLERPVTFHLWFERYGHLLRPLELAELLESSG